MNEKTEIIIGISFDVMNELGGGFHAVRFKLSFPS